MDRPFVAPLVLSLFFACAAESEPKVATPEAGPRASFDAGRTLDGGGTRAPPAKMDAAAAVRTSDGGPLDCVRGQYTAKTRPLDMFILLDQSGSMLEHEDRWTPTTRALKTFVGTAGLTRTGVAMQYFPLGPDDKTKCEVETYTLPDVAMADLPSNAQPTQRSIDAHHFTKEECCDSEEHSGTPTGPAVEGAAAYMRTWLANHPDHVGVILLATDGEPSGVCDDNDVSDVARIIAAAATSTPQVKTYVIGIGDNDSLNEMAEAGGTGEGALIVDGSGAQTEQQLLTALARIRNEALPCDFPVDTILDAKSLNVEWSVGQDGMTTQLVNVPRGEDCNKARATGWYYDDPNQPKRINLCPETCSALTSDVGVSVRIVEGCATVVLI